MLVRAFRVTDRLGNAALRISAWAVVFVVDQAAYLKNGLLGLVRTIWGTLAGLVLLTVATVRGARYTAQQAIEVTTATQTRFQQRMAQKAAEASLKPTFTEDPLRRQNRALSAFAVLLLLALLIVIVIQTTGDDQPEAPAVFGQWPQAQGTPAPTALFPTAIPTPTPIPDPLRVGGSLAFTVRENGQDDIWLLGVGTSSPLRLTNHPADDRDPAWSPDGSRIAFSSNRDGNWELYILELSTAAITRLTYSQGFEGAPTWSPDGAWLAYEGYYPERPDLDIYIISTDPALAAANGAQPVTFSPGPDIEPAWSPQGRSIAFTSWRTGNQDVFVISLDAGGGDAAALNITNSPDHENYPAWNPDGTMIAYSAQVNGVEGVYAKPAYDPAALSSLVGRGRMPSWAPNGGSLVYALDYSAGQRTQLITGVPGGFGASADAINLKFRAADPDWTAATLPSAFVLAGGAPPSPEIVQPLYTENARPIREPNGYGLAELNQVSAPIPRLSDRVNDSFEALRLRVLARTGYDYLGTLEDALWLQNRLPEPGEPRQNWHYTGRAIAIPRDQVYAAPPAPIEVVREDQEVNTYWRVYVRVVEQAQNGTFGEPLRVLPWDFAARSSGDPADYERGGRLKADVPTGYYVDLTQIMADYGWERLPALQTWEYTFGAIQFWEFVKSDGLTWEQAMLELYSPEDVATFLMDATPVPAPPPLPTASPTNEPPRTPTPLPPDMSS